MSGFCWSVPIEIMCTTITSQINSQVIMNTIAIGGTRKTCGVPPKKAAVHFITATPILMFFKLQQAQHIRIAVIPQTTYDPYM